MRKSRKFQILGILFYFMLTCSLQPAACNEDRPSSGDLIVKSWEVHGKKDIEATFKYTQQLIDLYKEQADKEQASLKAMPKNKNEIEVVQSLNDVATAYFIQAESYMNQGKREEAIKTFKIILEKYYFGQAWDPRGWFWSIAKASQESIDKLEGRTPAPTQPKVQVSQTPTKIVLYDAGKEDFVDYTRYGEFKNVGTKDYQYVVKDQEGLANAVGEGIYPNTTSIRWDPEYKKAKETKSLDGSQWDFIHSPDLEAAFLKWATSSNRRE